MLNNFCSMRSLHNCQSLQGAGLKFQTDSWTKHCVGKLLCHACRAYLWHFFEPCLPEGSLLKGHAPLSCKVFTLLFPNWSGGYLLPPVQAQRQKVWGHCWGFALLYGGQGCSNAQTRGPSPKIAKHLLSRPGGSRRITPFQSGRSMRRPCLPERFSQTGHTTLSKLGQSSPPAVSSSVLIIHDLQKLVRTCWRTY